VQRTLFRFVKQAVSVARKRTDTALMQIILTDNRTHTRRTRSKPFDGANGGSLVRQFHLISSTSISHPAGNGVAGWKHAVLHFLWFRIDATLEEVLD